MRDDLHTLVRAWDLGAIYAIRVPSTGTMHQTFLLDTAQGQRVLRAYRPCERSRVEREHAVIAYAAQQRLPVMVPIPWRTGETILGRNDRWYALFPYAPGVQWERAALDVPIIQAMGTALAHLHRTLTDFTHPLIPPRPAVIDRAATIAKLAWYERHIAQAPDPQGTNQAALRRLADQRRWIETHPLRPMAALDSLPQHVIHGDFTESNLFFQGSVVSAIIDWDKTYRAAREWEIIRTLDLVFGFAPPAACAFLQAYSTLMPLVLDHLELAAQWYGVMRAHDVWMYDEIYRRQNDRIRQFLGQHGFVDPYAAWQHLKPHLSAPDPE